VVLSKEEKKALDDKKKKAAANAKSRLMGYNKPEKGWMVLGVFCAMINGGLFPIFAQLLGMIVEVLAVPSDPDFRSQANFVAYMFLAVAAGLLIFNTLQTGIFAFIGESLTCRLRVDTFRKLLKMNIGWYDSPTNNAAALTTKLAKDCNLVNSLTSTILGITIQSLASFISGMVIAFTASWQLTLVSLGVAPLMMVAGQIQAKFNQGFSANTDDAFKEAGAFIGETVVNMRTVASFGKESVILKSYENKLAYPLKMGTKKGHISGAVFGLSNLAMFCTYAIVFYVGAVFNKNIGLSFRDMFISIFGVMFAAMGSGNASQFMPDVGAATAACISIFEILDLKPEIDIDNEEQTYGRKPGEMVKGEIEFKDVKFKYPSREEQILKGLSFKVKIGQKVALVGTSGCGKSTCMQLLLRFYDANEGAILIDGVDIKKWDLRVLRKAIGSVSQEPTLFKGTISYNIKYTKENASTEEIRAAAGQANALQFDEVNAASPTNPTEAAQKNPGDGLSREVGTKGNLISGGQKQRIAIARAILKNPCILLLDEATSALDSKNEKTVQKALDDLMKGKTSLCIAHRISTIKDSDEILVFNQGEIVERGKYDSLILSQGYFYKLERGLD
jgi:ATP-binding cassette subfamily B (MDR/TAP) protein 1